jgi:purine-binding chemotaxis protein CheW
LDLAKIRKKARQSPPAEVREAVSAGVEAPGEPQKVNGAPAAVPEPPQAPVGAPGPAQEEVPEPAAPREAPVPAEAPQPLAPRIERAPSARGERLLIFDAEAEKYAIPIHNISLIIEAGAITPIPNAPDFLLGILSLRGKIVSILDVARRLQLRRGVPDPPNKIIVLDLETDHFGLLVNAIDQLVEVELAALEPPPEGFAPLAEDFVEGVFHHKGRAVAFLNLPLFLSFKV